MRAVLKLVGTSTVPVLAVSLADGSEFVCHGEVVSKEQFARDYKEVDNASESGALAVSSTGVAASEETKPKRKR